MRNIALLVSTEDNHLFIARKEVLVSQEVEEDGADCVHVRFETVTLPTEGLWWYVAWRPINDARNLIIFMLLIFVKFCRFRDSFSVAKVSNPDIKLGTEILAPLLRRKRS